MNLLEKRFGNMLVEPKAGLIYYIACTETKRLKIGYTKGRVEKRLKALQTGSAGELTIIAAHPGNPEDERFLHHHFDAQRLRGEWFYMSEELFQHICMVTWICARGHILFGLPLEDWVKRGLQTMNEEVCELPADMAGLIE